MKKMYIKNKLYVIPSLLFCIGLQGIDAKTIPSNITQTNTTQTNTTQTNTLQANTDVSSDTDNHVNQHIYDVAITRVHNRPNRPKPNNTESQQNMPVSQKMPVSQTIPGAQYNMANMTETHNAAESYTMAESQNTTGALDAAWPQNNTELQYNVLGAQNTAGSLDTHFKTPNSAYSGYVINTMGYSSIPRAVVTQDDNKIVVVGVRDNYALLARYSSFGPLDSTFGRTSLYGHGVVIQKIDGNNVACSFNAVAIQNLDKKIITVGGSNNKGVLARYHNNHGDLDTSFGNGGIIKTDIPGELNAVAVQEDGKIVAAGYNMHNVADTQIMLIRYDKNGLRDTNFGTQGVVYSRIGRLSRAHAIAIQEEDHKIVVVGEVNLGGGATDIIVARYHENGTPDQSFGPNNSGAVIIDTKRVVNSAYDVVIQKDNKIVVVGSSSTMVTTKSQLTTIRLEKDGSLDTSFGNHRGIAIVMPIDSRLGDYGSARSVALDENENIIVMGYRIAENKDNSFVLIRYDQNGILDRTFGDNGIQNYILKLNPTSFNKAEIPVVGTIQNNKKKLVLAGMYSDKYSQTASLMAVARHLNY